MDGQYADNGAEYLEVNEGGGAGWFDDDDDGGYGDGGGFFDVEEVELNEEEKTNNMILNTEYKLYEEQHDYFAYHSKDKEHNNGEEEEDGFHKRYRYYSLGYDANYEEVDEKEISRWQHQFPYIHCVGFGYEYDTVEESIDISLGEMKGTEFDSPNLLILSTPEEIDSNHHNDICIEGKSIPLIAQPLNNREENNEQKDDEILAQDGIVEEFLALNRLPVNNNKSLRVCNNEEVEDENNQYSLAQRSSEEELFQHRRQGLWESCVDAMSELIEDIVEKELLKLR
jgi:hypothetical protein